jgi:hypothetical protein
MFDEHIHILALETVQFPKHQPQVSAVAVATHSPERSECCQFLSYFNAADVAGMPYFVARLKVVQVLFVPVRMRVTD